MATGKSSDRDVFVRNAIEAAVKIGVVLIIVWWCFLIMRPFVGILVWGIVIAIAIYPMAEWTGARLGGRYKAAAGIMTVLMLVILAIPAAELAALVVENVNDLSSTLEGETLRIPMPPDSVAAWPFIGTAVTEFWTLAATNLAEALSIIEPQLKAVGTWLVSALAGTGLGLLQFIAAMIVAGVFMAQARTAGEFAHALGRRLAGARGDELTGLAEATVRGVARGVIGVAVIQSVLAGIGLVLADIPGAGVWTVLCLLLAIVQIGVGPVMIGASIYLFATGETLPAVIFTIYAVPVILSDNVLRPLLMGRGLDVPMLIILIGTIGGMLLQGIVGLFIGAVILALGYKLFVAWVFETAEEPGANDISTIEP